MMKLELDIEHERVMKAMSYKICAFLVKLETYTNMNPLLRFFRCEHIKREVQGVQEMIMKLAQDLNHIEVKRELLAVKERQVYTDIEIRKIVS